MSSLKQNSELEVFIHDLATPVASIDVNLNLLREQILNENPKPEGAIVRAINSLNQLSYLIESKRNDLKSQTFKEEIFIYKEFVNIKTDYEFLLLRNKITFIINCSSQKLSIFGSKYRFKQVIDNLIRNAIDALIVSGKQDKKITCSIKKSSKRLVIAIHDNGCGMSKELMKNMFEQHFSTKQNHTGIGLWLVQEIVKKELKGKIRIESITNRYTKFSILI